MSGTVVNLADYRPSAPAPAEPTMTHEEWLRDYLAEGVRKLPRGQLLHRARQFVARGKPDSIAISLAMLALVRHQEGIERRLRKLERAQSQKKPAERGPR